MYLRSANTKAKKKIIMRLNIYYPGFLARSLFVLMLTILPVSVISSGTDTTTLSGTVSGRGGKPLENMQLILYPDPASFPGSAADTTYTSAGGEFHFALAGDMSYILEVRGEEGTGRVFVAAGTTEETTTKKLGITYPVTEKIVILHTNDLHFTLNNTEELALAIEEIRQKYDDVFLFDAGDIFVRHPMRWIVNGRFMRNPEWYGERALLMVSTMNDLGYDILAPGNHELAYHEPYTRIALEAAAFTLLAANVEVTTTGLPSFEDYVMLNTSTNRKVAVLGLTSGSAEGVRELSVPETVNKYLWLRDSSEVFVALTHLGLRRDRSLAGEFPQLDAIIGGHSHDLLEEAQVVNSVLIAQAGGNPHFVSDGHPVFLGKIIIVLENGMVAEKSGRVIEIKKSGQPAGDDDYYFNDVEAEPEFQDSEIDP
jgi:hypothetical protein